MKRPVLTRRYALSIAQEIKKRLSQSEYSVHGIFLFGSCAQNTMTSESDIDIAIVCEPFARSKVKEAVTFYTLFRGVDTRIEIIILHPDDLENRYLTIVQEIKQNGVAT